MTEGEIDKERNSKIGKAVFHAVRIIIDEVDNAFLEADKKLTEQPETTIE